MDLVLNSVCVFLLGQQTMSQTHKMCLCEGKWTAKKETSVRISQQNNSALQSGNSRIKWAASRFKRTMETGRPINATFASLNLQTRVHTLERVSVILCVSPGGTSRIPWSVSETSRIPWSVSETSRIPWSVSETSHITCSVSETSHIP